MKIAELFWQLRGEAGARQVPGTPERGVAQAWGDLMQVGTVVVMGTEERRERREVPPRPKPRRPTDTAARRQPLTDAEFRSAPGARRRRARHRVRVGSGRGDRRVPRRMRDGRIVAAIAWRAGGRSCPHASSANDASGPPTAGRGAGDGLVETFSICHVTWDMQPLDPPELPAVIRLDGASHGGFLHKLGEVAPDEVRIGMAVEAVWRPRPSGRARSWTSRTSGRSREGCVMARTVSGGMPVAFHYTPGVGKHRVLRGAPRPRRACSGSRCEACAYTYLPARIFCERCFAELRPTPSAVREERSSRSRSATSTSTANRWASR